jgi:hypothetical protein
VYAKPAKREKQSTYPKRFSRSDWKVEAVLEALLLARKKFQRDSNEHKSGKKYKRQ